MRAVVVLSINQHTKSEMPSFSHSKDMIGPQNLTNDPRPLGDSL